MEVSGTAPDFVDVEARAITSPVVLPSAAGCVRFQRESIGAPPDDGGTHGGRTPGRGARWRTRSDSSKVRTVSSARARCWWVQERFIQPKDCVLGGRVASLIRGPSIFLPHVGVWKP